MTFYHVDRSHRLKSGQTIDLIMTEITNLVENQNIIEESIIKYYNNQFSRHGHIYAFNDNVCNHTYNEIHSLIDSQNPEDYEKVANTLYRKFSNFALENILESVRLSKYPDKPSRFQSFFAFKNLEDAVTFSKNSHPIYEIASFNNQIHIGDMNLLSGNSVLSSFNSAISYWEGALSKSPILEILLTSPVEIGNVVFYPNDV